MTKDAHWVIAGVSLAAGLAVGALSQMDRVERCEAGSETELESAREEAPARTFRITPGPHHLGPMHRREKDR